jgi:hypothetical protein
METEMSTVKIYPLPRLQALPSTLPLERAVRIELEEGVPVFKASEFVHARIEKLLQKERRAALSAKEREELDRYEEVDDYLSFVNRLIRNLMQSQGGEGP